MLSKKLARIFANGKNFLRTHARKICVVLSVIGLITVGAFIIAHFWALIKFMIALTALGLVCGGFSRR